LQGVAVCCSVLQSHQHGGEASMSLVEGIVCYSELQCIVVCCSVSQCVAVSCSVLSCIVVCCSVFQCVPVCCSVLQSHQHGGEASMSLVEGIVCYSELQCVAVFRSVLQCVVVCCSVLQCAAENVSGECLKCTHCNTLQHTATYCNTLQLYNELQS